MSTITDDAKITKYRAAQEPLPTDIKRWHLTGAGLDALEEVSLPLPPFGPDELLVRHDACGICFSDIKIINLGPEHPRLQGRDMAREPVVMGHEVALTVVGVGGDLQDRFEIGQRFIVQADVYYKGANLAYGYQLDGGMAQYGVVTKEVLEGDEGLYLLPIQDGTGYVEAALVEPWACVVAAYEYPNYRDGVLDGGRLLVVHVSGALDGDRVKYLYADNHHPASVTTVEDVSGADFARLRQEETAGAGFDDIVVYGTPTAQELGRIATCLGKKGVLNLVSDKPLSGSVPVDVGRVHYEQQLFVGTDDPSKVLDAYTGNTRRDIKPSGKVWFVGAGGPMGQMHIQRAVMLPDPPKTIVVSDVSDERLGRIRTRFGRLMDERSIELIEVNPQTGGDAALYGPFDDIVSMVPVTGVISETMPALAQDGVYNIFAGLAKGSLSDLDLGTILAKNQRLVGTSGSSIADLQHTLDLVEGDTLSTNASLAAIGGLDAFRDGLAAVKEGRFPGKTVIFPQIEDLPLMSIEDIKTRLPDVYAKMQDGLFWTKDAEEELLRERLETMSMRLEGKSAIVTGAAQGLGEALARRLAVEGCDVLLSDVNEAKVCGAADAIERDTGRRVGAVQANVGNEADVANMVDEAIRAFGKLDILVANAGILRAHDVTEFPLDEWRAVIDINLTGYFLCAQAAAKAMIPNKSGAIVQINSKSGKKGSFRNSAYAASKFGGIGLTQSIALDLAPHGIRVNAVCPGNLLDGTLWQQSLYEQYAKTQGLTPDQVRAKYESQVPLGRGATYEDVSNVVVFLASDQSSYMTGQAINVTGGQEMR